MSTQLGPIHFWLYEKIQIQQDIVEDILKSGMRIDPMLHEELDSRYGPAEKGRLEEVINVENIHAWLQENVSRSEYRLAFSMTRLLAKESDFIHKAEEIYKKKGKEKAAHLEDDSENAMAVYKVIYDSLLDGMPCDHVNELLEENEEQVTWKRNSCVHKSYWEEVGGDVSVYYRLRDAFIRGVLTGTSLIYEKVEPDVYRIARDL